MNNYKIVIPVYWGHLDVIQVGISYIQKYLEPKEIVLLGPKSMEKELPKREGVSYRDGNSVCPGMSKESVLACITSCADGTKLYERRAGWYFQQFLKMAYATHCEESNYLVWDADLIPFRSLKFYENGKYNLYSGGSHHIEYYEVMERLFGRQVTPSRAETYVESFMLIDTACMRELVAMIEQRDSLEGTAFWEKIIHAIKPNKLDSQAFSEFETYGEFMALYHPDKIQSHDRLIRSSSGRRFLGKNPQPEMLDWVGQDLEAISFENWIKTNRLWYGIARFLCGKIRFRIIMRINEKFSGWNEQAKYRIKKLKRMIWKHEEG